MKFLDVYKKYGIYFIFLFVFLFFSVTTKNFLSVDNLLNVLRQVSMFGIVVLGVTFVMIGGGADLSVGGMMAVSGIITGVLLAKLGVPILLAAIICILLCGFFEFTFLGQGYLWIIPVPVIIFLIMVALAWFVLEKTYLGRRIYAMGGNPEAARLAGVNLDKMRILVFSLSGFVTGLASLIMLSRTNSGQPGAGASYPFDSMTAAVLGGISFGGGEGRVFGAVMGVLIIGILNNGLILMGVNSNWQGVIKGLVLIAAVGIDNVQRKAKKARIAAA